jgi:hypothetical protein
MVIRPIQNLGIYITTVDINHKKESTFMETLIHISCEKKIITEKISIDHSPILIY